MRFTPAERGSDPFLNLMRRLAPTLASPSTLLETIADTLRTHPSEINALAGQVLQGKSANAELLLFADQFEEIFSARVEERHRGPFISLMDEIARSPRIRLVLTLRADYYEHCTRDPRLAAWLREGSFPLAAPTPLALAEMIERPARVAGLDPEPGLADAILRDAGTEPGALALVEFALEELYERSGGKRLTLAAYRALGGKGGGIGGVIEGQAEKAVQDAAGKVDEAALAKIFPLLADVDEQGGAVRKRARRDSFAEREEALIHRLVDGRLLVSNKDDANLSWVEVAHEAVLRHWQRFALARSQPALSPFAKTLEVYPRQSKLPARRSARRGPRVDEGARAPLRCRGACVYRTEPPGLFAIGGSEGRWPPRSRWWSRPAPRWGIKKTSASDRSSREENWAAHPRLAPSKGAAAKSPLGTEAHGEKGHHTKSASATPLS